VAGNEAKNVCCYDLTDDSAAPGGGANAISECKAYDSGAGFYALAGDETATKIESIVFVVNGIEQTEAGSAKPAGGAGAGGAGGAGAGTAAATSGGCTTGTGGVGPTAPLDTGSRSFAGFTQAVSHL